MFNNEMTDFERKEVEVESVIDLGFSKDFLIPDTEILYFYSFNSKNNKNSVRKYEFFDEKEGKIDKDFITYVPNIFLYSVKINLENDLYSHCSIEQIIQKFYSSTSKVIEFSNIITLIDSSISSITNKELSYDLLITLDNISNLIIPIIFKHKLFSLLIQKKIISLLIPSVCSYLIKSNETDKIINTILPFLIEIIKENSKITLKSNKNINEDQSNHRDIIKNESINTILSIIKTFPTEEFTINLLTNTIELANDDTSFQNKVISIELFSLISEHIEPDQLELYIIPQLIFLSDDSNFLIRKAISMNIIKLSVRLNKETFNNLVFSLYLNLLNDSVWVVQKASAENIMHIVSLCNIDNKKKLMKCYVHLITNSELYVKISLLENIGEFISLYPSLEIPEEIFIFFKTNLEYYLIESNRDNDLLFKIAFNFPAIIYLNSNLLKFWLETKDLYYKLCRDKDFSVRKSLSSSFPKINQILSCFNREFYYRNTEFSMFEMFKFYWTNEDETYKRLLENIEIYYDSVSDTMKSLILEMLIERVKLTVSSKSKDWRMKSLFLEKLFKISVFIKIDLFFISIFPIITTFLYDDSCLLRDNVTLYLGEKLGESIVSLLELSIKLTVTEKDDYNSLFIFEEIINIIGFNKNWIYRKHFGNLLLGIINNSRLFKVINSYKLNPNHIPPQINCLLVLLNRIVSNQLNDKVKNISISLRNKFKNIINIDEFQFTSCSIEVNESYSKERDIFELDNINLNILIK